MEARWGWWQRFLCRLAFIIEIHTVSHTQCYDWVNRVLASYTEETKQLEVTERGYAILDQVCCHDMHPAIQLIMRTV